MFENKKIAFIGSGMMAEAIMAGLIQQGLIAAEQIIASDIRQSRVDDLQKIHGITPTTDNSWATAQADYIVLAVKPQYFADAAPSIKAAISSEALAISIMAGTTIETMQTLLDHNRVVRSMPNTPATIGQGMTVWTASAEVSAEQKEVAEQVLTAFGKAIYVEKESYVDIATAINGSGPGFVFLMLESMIDAAVRMGFARPVAEELVTQTMLGSAMYAQESDLHVAELRNRVTSPGGTTAAGLYTMEKGGLRTVLADGLWAAYQRSVELGSK